MKWWGRIIDAVPGNQVYNMDADIEEQQNVAAVHPDVVAVLMTIAEQARRKLGDHDRLVENVRYCDTNVPRPQTPEDRHLTPREAR